jgi:hypothetical protein
MKRFAQLAVLAALAGTLGQAQAYTIDGDLSDWGLTQTGAASDWTPNANVDAWAVEDQTGNGTYLSPGWGGQKYDAEAIYLDISGGKLNIAIVTGHSPLTPQGGGSYAPGDIGIDFGINGSYEFGLETTGSNGNTAGTLYSVSSWGAGLWGASNQGPTSILAGAVAGVGDVDYTIAGESNMGIYSADKHYYYEASIPLSAFGANWGSGPFQVHWTMNCANDSIKVGVTDPNVYRHIPEPASLALLGLGFAGMLASRRRALKSIAGPSQD